MEMEGFMLFLKKLLLINLLLVPAYNLCMENNSNSGKQEVEQVAPKLPIDVFTNEAIKHTLIAFIKEYDNSRDENRLKIFLKQFLNLQLVSKQVKNFLVAPTDKIIKYFAPNEPLLVVCSTVKFKYIVRTNFTKPKS